MLRFMTAPHAYCLALLFSLALTPALAHAQDDISYELKDHWVYYNVFNSSLIPADVASKKNLIRAKDRAYVNIALVKKSGGYGIPPENMEGIYRNLLQQKFPLDFIEIKEATATYYLAPIRFNNEEILHIDITIKADKESPQETFTITQKPYRD